jgi:hypothetical protein
MKRRFRSVLGIEATLRLVEPGSLSRMDGAAGLVIDNRMPYAP